MFLNIVLMLVVVCGYTTGDVSHLLTSSSTTTPPSPPPKPYAFGYAAGRFPGHIDRTHSEVSDGSGIVQGSYSYIDPYYRIRTVEYIADQNGFHPQLNLNPPPLPSDTPIVAEAKQKHLIQFDRIAQNHQHAQQQQPNLIVPIDSVAVSRAKDKHYSLYQKIAEEHAKIAAEREAERLANEGTEIPIYNEHSIVH